MKSEKVPRESETAKQPFQKAFQLLVTVRESRKRRTNDGKGQENRVADLPLQLLHALSYFRGENVGRWRKKTPKRLIRFRKTNGHLLCKETGGERILQKVKTSISKQKSASTSSIEQKFKGIPSISEISNES